MNAHKCVEITLKNTFLIRKSMYHVLQVPSRFPHCFFMTEPYAVRSILSRV